MGTSSEKARYLPLLKLLEKRFPQWEGSFLYSRILCGEVLVDGGTIRDPKLKVSSLADIQLKDSGFVSRGGEKLESALSFFSVTVQGKIFLDAGCSTGGFTHSLLSRGALIIHAIDVGYNLLDYSLRNNPQVLVKERTNIMDVNHLDPVPHAAVADLSFRSLRGAASHILQLTSEKWAIVLVKPQFEWLDPPGTFNGIVSAMGDRKSIIKQVASDLNEEGVGVRSAVASAVPGRKGNQEYFFLLDFSPGLSPEEILDRLF